MQTEGTTLSSGARAVDVLGVLDRGIAFESASGYRDDLVSARAAVAELVAAAKAYQAVSGVAPTFGEVRDARKRLFAALARMEPQS